MDEYRVALTPEQVELITALVEASKSVRQEFMILRTMQGPFIRHPAFPGGQLDVYEPDFQAIEDLGLLTITHYDSRTGGARFSRSHHKGGTSTNTLILSRNPRRTPSKKTYAASSTRTRSSASTPPLSSGGRRQHAFCGLTTPAGS